MSNTNTNIFEVAVRSKMRFPFKGLISVEELFDLSVENLDSIFKTLNSQLKKAQEDSLLNAKTKEDKELDIKIEIIKYIVKSKLEEKEVQSKLKDKREQKQKILEILADKKYEELKNKSADELEKMLQE